MKFIFTAIVLSIGFQAAPAWADPIVQMAFEKQTQSNWCWAATSTATINHMRKRKKLDPTVRQCRVVTHYNKVDSDAAYCCNAGNASSSKCNQPGSMYEPINAHGFLQKQENGQLNDDRFNRLIDQLGKGRPVPGAVRWVGQDVGHAILVYGLGFGGFAGGQAIYIYDPTTGKQAGMQDRGELNNYGSAFNGSWKATYYLKD